MSFTIFTASVSKILDTTLYYSSDSGKHTICVTYIRASKFEVAFKVTTPTFRGVGDGRKPMKPASVHNGNVIPHSNIQI